MFRRFLTYFCKDQSGAVAVEFVLIGPMLFALLFGVVTLGYFIGLSHSVQQLATGAARASVAGLDAAERSALAETYLSEAGSRYPLLVADAISPIVEVSGDSEPSINVDISYAIDGSLLDIANDFLGFGITTITGSAYLAY
ncbi:TadE/TadG family type IV pilus assembly protein [Flavimaricola marinus]|uniref:TadE-like protein n=1 Tax=Flavimaricola marinus TaxID=1819565 RepID=A0A238LGR5_9RHOB|nr:TadE/TadG family type IV pilus assembly protein [Flavimaricola marinus]SMY08927.1 TadE-like protein [Flavimaricola marinus]